MLCLDKTIKESNSLIWRI